jgi:hypothetical protein
LGFACFVIFSGFGYEINYLRNARALMLFIISLKYLENRKLLKYMIVNILGALFHMSSLIYLPFYFILNRKYPRKLIIFLFMLGNVVYLFSIKWLKDLLLLILSINLENSTVIRKVKGYTESVFFSSDFGFTIGYFEKIFTLLLVVIFYNKLLRKSSKNLIFINITIAYCFIHLYCSEMFIFRQRIALLFQLGYWILYPQIYGLISKRSKLLFLCIFLLYGGMRLIKNNSYVSVKYENILFLNYSSFDIRKDMAIKSLDQQM